MKLAEKTKLALELEKQIDEVKKNSLYPLQEKYEAIRNEIKEDIKGVGEEIGGKITVRLELATITLAKRVTHKIIDENKIIGVLKKMKLAKEYVAPRLKDTFNLKDFIAQKGVVAGVETQETEYISIRAKGKDEQDN